MTICKERCRCAAGPYEGVAYDCSSPCGGGSSWKGCFDGCEPDIPTGRIRVMVTESVNNRSYNGVVNPGDVLIPLPAVLTILEAPYFEPDGSLRTQRIIFNSAPTWAGRCDPNIPGNEPCWMAEGLIEGDKSATCSGGGPYWLLCGAYDYRDGAIIPGSLPDFSYVFSLGGTGCGAPVGTFSSVTIAYEQELEDGSWASWTPPDDWKDG